MLRAFGLTDVGRVRKSNEDTFLIDPLLNLYLVADGMGGHNAGEVASQVATEAIEGFIRRSEASSDITWPYGIDPTLSAAGNRLRTAIKVANRRVFKTAESYDNYTGMGTTVVAAIIQNDQMAFGNVGDSRLYSFDGKKLTQLTIDDSWAATMLAHDPDHAPKSVMEHPLRNVLTNVLGAREQTEVHMVDRPLADSELVLLCSDGLHSALDDDTIAAILGRSGDLETRARALIDTANGRDGRDNVTVVLIEHHADGKER